MRIYLDPTGEFTDDTQSKIIAQIEAEFIDKFGMPQVAVLEKENYYSIASEKVVLHFYKSPFRVEAYKKDKLTLIFKEIEPIAYTQEQVIQTLEGDESEYFYGGGVQNGHFSHKNKKIDIELKISHWNAGSVSNPAPFYMSTKGYGQFRNTFNKGSYAFFETTTLIHQEGKSDTFYFFGETLGDILNLYTELTGKPNLIPRWGLMPGDANCYKETMDALKVAKQYVEHDIPRGWILPNDGYGCGYTDLKGFVGEAEKLGFKVGLWTENSMEKLAEEVGEFGLRVVKTDVAWVGPGYAFGLDGVKQCFDGIEDNCEDRAYLWTCCGWAGTQRYSTVKAPQAEDEQLTIHVDNTVGSYRGIKEKRKYEFAIHTKVNPGKVTFNVQGSTFEVQEVETKEAYDSTESNVMHFDKVRLTYQLLIQWNLKKLIRLINSSTNQGQKELKEISQNTTYRLVKMGHITKILYVMEYGQTKMNLTS